jgi:dihydroneopterin aldolase
MSKETGRDTIVIKELEVDMHIGVTEEERVHTQKLLVTVELERGLAEAGRTDMESSTTSYAVVADMIRKVVAERPRKLIEAVATEIAEVILDHRLAMTVTVEVKKFSIPKTKYVSVQITRSQ